jgi:hypothetical protein
MELFDKMLASENLLANDPQNVQLKQSYAEKRYHYTFAKEHALQTGPQQAGLTDDEIAEAERLAAGDTGPVTVELDTDLAAQL